MIFEITPSLQDRLIKTLRLAPGPKREIGETTLETLNQINGLSIPEVVDEYNLSSETVTDLWITVLLAKGCFTNKAKSYGLTQQFSEMYEEE